MMVLVGGAPQNLEQWKLEVVMPLTNAIGEGVALLTFAKKHLYHTCGDGFAALASGPSHGGEEKVSVFLSLIFLLVDSHVLVPWEPYAFTARTYFYGFHS